MRTCLIAEIGPNHCGRTDLALEMIDRLAELDIDAVKFQLARPENVYSKDAFKVSYQKQNDAAPTPIEMSRRIQLPYEEHKKLYARCREKGVAYLCTAFDIESLRFLDDHFDMPFYKVPSGEIHTIDMMEHMARGSRPVLLSTGMASFDDIGKAVDLLTVHNPRDITILHCVSNYPAPPEDVNLAVMTELRRRFGRPVGYSDHTFGNEVALAAVGMGATVVEKHVTLDRTLPGPDHKASATIEEFADLVRAIRAVEKAIGVSDKVFSPAETEIRAAARKSIVTTRDLNPGHVITAQDICYKRPGTGISPLETETVIGRTVMCAIEADRVLTWEHLRP